MGRKSKKDQRRLEIIQAFFTCVETSGMAGASIRKIAKGADLHPSIVLHYFKNREELIEEAVKVYTDKIFEQFKLKLEKLNQPSQTKEAASIETAPEYESCTPMEIPGLSFIFSDHMINDVHTGFFLECLVAARKNFRIRSFMAQMFVRFRQVIVAQLSQIPGFDRLDPARQQQLAATVVAIHEGIELQWFTDPEAVSLDKSFALTRELINYVVKSSGDK